MPNIASSLRRVPDAGSIGTIQALYDVLTADPNQPVKQQGLLEDLIIGATAIDTGRPLITADQRLAEAVQALGGIVTLFP